MGAHGSDITEALGKQKPRLIAGLQISQKEPDVRQERVNDEPTWGRDVCVTVTGTGEQSCPKLEAQCGRAAAMQRCSPPRPREAGSSPDAEGFQGEDTRGGVLVEHPPVAAHTSYSPGVASALRWGSCELCTHWGTGQGTGP